MKTKIILSNFEYDHLKIKDGFQVSIDISQTDNGDVLFVVDSENLRDIYINIENQVYTFFLKKEHYDFLNRITTNKSQNISCHIQQDVVILTFSGSDTLMNVYHTLENRLLCDGFDKNDNITSDGEIIEYLMDTFTF